MGWHFCNDCTLQLLLSSDSRAGPAALREEQPSFPGFLAQQARPALSLINTGRSDLAQVSQGSTPARSAARNHDSPTALEVSHSKLCFRDRSALKSNPAALGPDGGQPQSTSLGL